MYLSIQRAGTVAAKMPDQIPERSNTKNILIDLADQMSRDYSYVGKIETILVEEEIYLRKA